MKQISICVVLHIVLFFGFERLAHAEGETAFEQVRNKLQRIISVNHEFVESRNRVDFETFLEGQSPLATLVMCSDSRVQPEPVHDSPEGKLFTIRNIGNQIASNKGSVDYGVLVLKTPLLLILGHTDCGAVKAVMAGYSDATQSIKAELNTIRIGDAKDEKQALVNNVNSQIDIAIEKYKELIDKKLLFVVGGIYDIQNIFGYGHGSLVFTNINGISGAAAVADHPLLKGLEKVKVMN